MTPINLAPDLVTTTTGTPIPITPTMKGLFEHERALEGLCAMLIQGSLGAHHILGRIFTEQPLQADMIIRTLVFANDSDTMLMGQKLVDAVRSGYGKDWEIFMEAIRLQLSHLTRWYSAHEKINDIFTQPHSDRLGPLQNLDTHHPWPVFSHLHSPPQGFDPRAFVTRLFDLLEQGTSVCDRRLQTFAHTMIRGTRKHNPEFNTQWTFIAMVAILFVPEILQAFPTPSP